MRYSKLFVHFVLLFTIPSLVLYPHQALPPTSYNHETAQILTDNGQLMSVDELTGFVNALEAGELDGVFNEEEMQRINRMLVVLSREGALHDGSPEEESLEDDIQELLHSTNDDAEQYSFSMHPGNDYIFAPLFFANQQRILPCKSWISKQCHHVKKFVKNHKKAIIIGAIIIVAATVVVCAVAATTAASAGAAAAASGSNKPKHKNSSTEPSETSTVSPALAAIDNVPVLKSSIDGNASSFKEFVIANNLTNQSIDDPRFQEQLRELGAFLAHETLEGIAELTVAFPQLFEEMGNVGSKMFPNYTLSHSDFLNPAPPIENFNNMISSGHKKIDELFSIDDSHKYIPSLAKPDRVIGTIPLPGNIKGINFSRFKEAMKAGQSASVAEEIGLSAYEIAQLEQTGTLDKTIARTVKGLMSEKTMMESLSTFKRAETFLKPYGGHYLSEAQARELIQQAGIRTFPRPNGIPGNYRVKLSDKPGGMKYIHPQNEGTYVRVMPGKPHSPFQQQKEPYINHRVNGKSLDKFGNMVSNDSPEAHIPIDEFIYREQ